MEFKVTFASRSDRPGVVLFDRTSGRELARMPFDRSRRIGNVYAMTIEGYEPDRVAYSFLEGDDIVPDRCAMAYLKVKPYGTKRTPSELKAIIPGEFDWEKDENPRIPYEDVIAYCMHVRGFTAHPSSGVVHRGTFAGLFEKIEYLSATGITTLELQPIYEFIELAGSENTSKNVPIRGKDNSRLNYWGYTEGCYYAPKAAYAAGEDASVEFKELVKKLHANHMEVVLQMYFPAGFSAVEMSNILRFWVLTYHVDGFHLMGDNIPAGMLASDPMLADTKLWFYGFDKDVLYGRDYAPRYRNLAVYADHYYYDMRKFLKGDEGALSSLAFNLRHIPEQMGRIHFLSNYYGLTLTDSVSYNDKHNEANGEDNRDGSDYNASWNSGVEGETSDGEILALRLQRLKNAYTLLLMSQSTPLLFMGDEFGNSQKGNNNPYCLDNETTYLDWNDLERNREQYEFFLSLVSLRKAHPVLRPGVEASVTDSISCGYPGISFHGENAWRASYEYNKRSLGVMYCGAYAKKEDGSADDFFYLAMNMHEDHRILALPKLPGGLKWQPVIATGEKQESITDEELRLLLEAERPALLRQSESMLNDIKAIELKVLGAEREKLANALKEKALRASQSEGNECTCTDEVSTKHVCSDESSKTVVYVDVASKQGADKPVNAENSFEGAPALKPELFYDSELMRSIPGRSVAVYMSVPDEKCVKKRSGRRGRLKFDEERQSF